MSEYSHLKFCRTCVRVLSTADAHQHATEPVPVADEDGCNRCVACVSSLPCTEYQRRDDAVVIGLKAPPMTSRGSRSGLPGTFDSPFN